MPNENKFFIYKIYFFGFYQRIPADKIFDSKSICLRHFDFEQFAVSLA